jgi:hypothetical protein
MQLVLNNEELREALLTGLRTKGWRINEIEKIVDFDNDENEDITNLQVTFNVKEPKVVTYDDREGES